MNEITIHKIGAALSIILFISSLALIISVIQINMIDVGDMIAIKPAFTIFGSFIGVINMIISIIVFNMSIKELKKHETSS